MARTWSAVLARLGTPTGDGRIIDPAGISFRDLPIPLAWQEKTSDGHDGAVTVGAIQSVSVENGMVTGTGTLLDLFPDRERLIELIDAGVVGPSVDISDDVEYVVDDSDRTVITRAGIGGATLVMIEAFSDVSITMDPEPVEPLGAEEESRPMTDEEGAMIGESFFSLTASVRSEGWSDMPLADESRDWDGDAAADRVFAWATDDGTTDWGRYARAFLRKDDDADPETRGAYGFGIADVIGGTLTIVPRGVFAAAAAVQGSRTGKAPEDAEGMKRVLRAIYERMDRTAPFSLTASAGGTEVQLASLPPLDWFMKPDLDRVTPLTVSNTGRVFGHIAPWGSCHVGLPGCVTPPFSYSNYSYFLQSSQPLADGTEIPVGTLVAGPRHADAQLAFHAATQHYDDPSAAVAKVMAGEDKFGIWVAGWILPTATPEARQIFMSSPVSGDWRRIGGNLELIAVCSVNAAGFPIPKARVAFSNGHQRTLIGTFGVRPVLAGGTEGGTLSPSVDEARARWVWATREGR